MSIVGSLTRVVAASAALYVCVFASGALSQRERDLPLLKLDDAMSKAGRIVKSCGGYSSDDVGAALVTYLAIEEYFRPAWLRALEFRLAGFGSILGLVPVDTLGIGQIGLSTYLSVRADAADSSDKGLHRWISEARDNCANVALLQDYARHRQLACSGQGFRCSLLYTCFWHTGRTDSCRGGALDEAYRQNVTAVYSRLATEAVPRSDRSEGGLNSFAEKRGRVPRPQ